MALPRPCSAPPRGYDKAVLPGLGPDVGCPPSLSQESYADSAALDAARRSVYAARNFGREERERRWKAWLRQQRAAGAEAANDADRAAHRTTEEVALCRGVPQELQDAQWRSWLSQRRARGRRGRSAGRVREPALPERAAMLERCEELWRATPTGRPAPSEGFWAGTASVLPAGAVISGASSAATMDPRPPRERDGRKGELREVVVPPRSAGHPPPRPRPQPRSSELRPRIMREPPACPHG